MSRIVMFTLAVSLVALASGARAQTAAERNACGVDAKKFCAKVKPGGGRLLDCLAAQKSQISDACKGVLARYGK